MIPKENITGIVLAGGKSSRMGKDKGMIPFHGSTFIERIIKTVAPFVSELIISANDPGYAELGYSQIRDLVPEKGPLGGIISAGGSCRTKYMLVVSCDLPMLQPGVISSIINQAGQGYEAIVPLHSGKAEPLCALYSVSVLPIFKKQIEEDDLKMRNILKKILVHYVDIPGHLGGNSFLNVNTPEELRNLETQYP